MLFLGLHKKNAVLLQLKKKMHLISGMRKLVLLFCLILTSACGQESAEGMPGNGGGNAEDSAVTFETTSIGANFNENIQEIAGVYNELNATGTEYIRSFINITPYLKRNTAGITGINTNAVAMSTLPAQFVAVKTQVPKAKLVLSIKIVFKNLPGEVPSKGSEGVRHVIDCVLQLLEKDNLGNSIDVLVLGNEPMWENGENVANPVNYADFVAAFASAASSWRVSKGWNYKIFAGALNRVSVQDSINANVGAIIDAASASPDIDGLDIHLHNSEVEECEVSLKVVREKYMFTKQLMCSELSMVWKLNKLMNTKLGSWGPDHGYSSTMKRYEWLNQASAKALNGTPVSSEEFLSFFMDGIPDYPRNWFTTYYDAFLKYDVSFVTPRFSAVESDEEYTAGSTMWALGAIFSARFLGRAADGSMNPSPLMFPEVKAARLRKK